jgi:hypothetical protein
MGVDAEMFVRIKGREHWLADDDELLAAYQLASTIGHDSYLITLGGDSSFSQHHALSIMRPIKDASDAEDHGLDADSVGKVVWTQDGDPIVAAPDEQFIKVHLWTRYYGEDYARGNWPIIRVTAEWLAMRFPAGEVWYGGDSSGICAEHLTAERLATLNNFFLSSGRRTYTRYDSPFRSARGSCECLTCRQPMIDTGGGQGQQFWFCDGCGAEAVTAAGHEPYRGKRSRDEHSIFKLADEARKAWGLAP